MTYAEMVKELLPKNATPLERCITEVMLERIDEMPMLIATLWDNETCPAELLPFLAWAVSVDVWDEAWEESVKRRVIGAAPKVHRMKASLQAVEAALSAMGIRAQIKEWWEEVPEARRATFTVTALANAHINRGGPILSDDVQAQILRQVYAVKPKARPVTLKIGAEFSGEVGVANGMSSLTVQRAEGDAGPQSRLASEGGRGQCALNPPRRPVRL